MSSTTMKNILSNYSEKIQSKDAINLSISLFAELKIPLTKKEIKPMLEKCFPDEISKENFISTIIQFLPRGM